MTDQPEIDGLDPNSLRNDQVDAGLLELCQEKANDAGHPTESEAHIINRALYLYLELENPNEMLTGGPN